MHLNQQALVQLVSFAGMSSEPAQQSPEPADDRAHDDWAHQLGHLLWDVSTRTMVLGEAEFLGPLSFAAVGILDQIDAEPGITIAEISRRVPKTQQAISQVTARLEKLGYVERKLGPRRGIGLHLTEAGVTAHAAGRASEAALERHLRDLFGEAHYEQLRSLLDQARSRLTAEHG